MKKLVLIILAIISFVVSSHAEMFEIKMADGTTMHGKFIARTDSTLTIKDSEHADIIRLSVNDFVTAKSQEGGRFYTQDGRLYGISRTEYKQGQKDKKQNSSSVQPSDPNYAIGNAMYKTGKAALIFGVPTMVTGAILMACGYAKPNQLRQMTKDKEAGKEIDQKKYNNLVIDVAKNGDTYDNCVTAGCVLLPFGSALTIVGIPLVKHGKKIMDLSFQVSENGAGVAVNF